MYENKTMTSAEIVLRKKGRRMEKKDGGGESN
jgi:hypothetical protein